MAFFLHCLGKLGQTLVTSLQQTDMAHIIKTIVHDYSWIHRGLGLFGNFSFFVGSILFLPRFEPMKTFGVWLFIIGAFFMLIGSTGRLLVGIWEKKNGDG